MNRSLLCACLVGLSACPAPPPVDDAGVVTPTDAGADAGPVDAGPAPLALPADAGWVPLQTVAVTFKQDDVHFIDPERGWYGTPTGLLYRTTNGGQTWEQVLSQPGTHWRALGFVDENLGYLGNIGTGVFPGVTDPTPLYVTTNGGMTVTPVTYSGPAVSGICALDVLRVNGKTIVHAAGRVGGPAHLITSVDGTRFESIDLSAHIAMITDVKFTSETTGFIVGGTTSTPTTSHAVIIKTTDGGATWRRVYESSRPYELIWKLSMPTATNGFATVQSYDSSRSLQVIVATATAGEAWVELPLTDDASARQLGIGFISETTGWVGTAAGAFQTVDGAQTWQPVELGRAVNKLRVVRAAHGFVAYSIGLQLYKLDARR